MTLFDLIGPHEEVISIQSPRRLPTVDAMVGEGQTVLQKGETSTDLAYLHGARRFFQRHEIVCLGPGCPGHSLIVTVQCPLVQRDAAVSALGVVSSSLKPAAE